MSPNITTDDLVDRAKIKELRATYCYCLDEQDWETFVGLFTEDAVLDYGARIGRREGREGIEAVTEFIDELVDVSTHMMMNPKLTIDGDVAYGRWYVDARESFASGKTGITQGEFRDVYRRVDGEWKIAELDFQVQYQFIFDENEQPESIRRKTVTEPLAEDGRA